MMSLVRCDSSHRRAVASVFRLRYLMCKGLLRSEDQSLDGGFEFRSPVSKEFYPCPLAPICSATAEKIEQVRGRTVEQVRRTGTQA